MASKKWIGLRGNDSKNICSRLSSHAQLTVNPVNFICNLPTGVPNNLSSLHLKAFFRLKPTVALLEARNPAKVLRGLHRLKDFLAQPHFLDTHRVYVYYEDRRMVSSDQETLYMFIRDYGLIELLLSFLIHISSDVKSEEHDVYCQIQTSVLNILSSLCLMEDSRFYDKLKQSDDLLVFCFHSVIHPCLYREACQLIEKLVVIRDSPLDLCVIPELKEVLAKITEKQVRPFTKVLCLSLSDLDVFQNPYSLVAQNVDTRAQSLMKLRDLNQELVVSAPNFLDKLVSFACELPSPSPAQNEVGRWKDYIEHHLFGNESESEMEDGSCSSSNRDLLFSNEYEHKCESFFVLRLFFLKNRFEMQQKMGELRLISKMSELMDTFHWPRARTHNSLHRHHCEMSPDMTMKIQFLRLLHTFSDHNEMKYLLMTSNEWEELREIKVQQKQEVAKTSISRDDLMLRQGEVGIVSKLVTILKEENSSSSIKYWLCRAIESFLRGQDSYGEQIFLLRRGLLKHVIGTVISANLREKELIQASFDLLGEMVKFNYEACVQLDASLNSEVCLKNAIVRINDNLVDSNMFVRAMILGCDCFQESESEEQKVFLKNSRLLNFFRDIEKQVNYVVRLVDTINVEKLTQENVSCLNTSLIILMLNHRKDNLSKFLHAIKTNVSSDAEEENRKQILQNLKKLLIFWSSHYLNKDKDCSQLEKSSRMPFTFWSATVKSLVAEDPNDPLSISYHLENENFDRQN